MADDAERDRLASDLAIPITQLAGLLCGMRKYTGADGDEWLHWISCLDEPVNELGSIFEAVLDGAGSYERVIDGRSLFRPHGSPAGVAAAERKILSERDALAAAAFDEAAADRDERAADARRHDRIDEQREHNERAAEYRAERDRLEAGR